MLGFQLSLSKTSQFVLFPSADTLLHLVGTLYQENQSVQLHRLMNVEFPTPTAQHPFLLSYDYLLDGA